MTLVLDLTPEEEQRIQGARAIGIDVDALIKGVIAALPVGIPESSRNRTEELFAQWEAEDADMTPEEIVAEVADWEAFKQRVNANRAETGERPIFK